MSDEDEITRLMSPDEMDYLLETAGINALQGIINQDGSDGAGAYVEADDITQINSHESIRQRSPSGLSVVKSIDGRAWTEEAILPVRSYHGHMHGGIYMYDCYNTASDG